MVELSSLEVLAPSYSIDSMLVFMVFVFVKVDLRLMIPSSFPWVVRKCDHELVVYPSYTFIVVASSRFG